MKLQVIRFHDNGDATLGLLFIDGDFECFTLEDEYRDKKVRGETRVPKGTYRITLRQEGGYHTRYKAKFGSMHKGMLWVREVPGFEWILFHIGNTDENTAGCLLVGESAKDGFIGGSTDAYKKMYPKICDAILRGEEVTVTYHDLDRDFALAI